jgi:hypothetical protein
MPEGSAMAIVPYLDGRVFAPQDIEAMSTALRDLYAILNLTDDDKSEREFLAKRIIALSQRGERNAALLRDRILREIARGQGEWPTGLIRAARQGAL